MWRWSWPRFAPTAFSSVYNRINGDWAKSLTIEAQLAQNDGFELQLMTKENQRRLLFLYGKKVFDEDKVSRIPAFRHVLEPTTAPSEEQEMYRGAQGRLNRLVDVDGDTTYATVPPGIQTFEDFVASTPQWRETVNPNSWVSFRDDINISRKYNARVQRVQGSSVSYGPCVVQHYLVAKHNEGVEGVGTIDMTKMIRDTLDSEAMTDYIFENEEGESVDMLGEILIPRSVISISHPTLYEEHLKKFGPGLVSRFKVHSDFGDDNTHAHHGKPPSNADFKGLHSMALVGVRRDENGKRFYLLQNWWSRKQFVEVDGDYLQACKAWVFFVETPQPYIPEQFPITTAMYAEN